MRNSALIVGLLCLLVACGSSSQRRQAEELLEEAHRIRYMSVHEADSLARRAAIICPSLADRSLVTQAYVSYQQMDFQRVDSLLDEVQRHSSDPITLLCADVMQMKTCQRTGDGLRFFQAKTAAEKRVKDIAKRERSLSNDDRYRFVYAQSEMHLIASTYYYYQEQDSLAQAEMRALHPLDLDHHDTAQWLYSLYMLGSGGLVDEPDADECTVAEFDYAFRTYNISHRCGYLYFEANALQTLAMQLATHSALLADHRPADCRLLHSRYAETDTAAEALPFLLCHEAIRLFTLYDDLFQTACCWRTLGEIHFLNGEYEQALSAYTQALHCVNVHHQRHYGVDTLRLYDPALMDESTEMQWISDEGVLTVPEWIASIRQQLSLVYSALDMKSESDFNHNAYLDLLELVGQNREQESRNQELRAQTRSMQRRIAMALALMVLSVALLLVHRRRLRRRSLALLQELEELQNTPHPDFLQPMEDECEEAAEQLAVSRQRLADNKRSNAEKRAKVSLVHDIVPFLDRIGGEVIRMRRSGRVEPERREYICELVDRIEQYNAVLTEWIKMQQGQLSLHITTVPLQQLFDIVRHSQYTFQRKGVTLQVEDTVARVKADESLTLFMINTLADNARKFTPQGGSVTVRAVEADGYVEVQVEDTGCGLSPEDVDTLNHSKVYDPSQIGAAANVQPSDSRDERKGFGFGLMNCRGIIERYRKQSQLFACCRFGVRSEVGQGSTFFFRLPRVATMLALFFALSASAEPQPQATPQALYDSVYQCNLDGRYREAIAYGREALCLIHPSLQLNDSLHAEGNEIRLFTKGRQKLDYETVVGLRNELSLSALALHDWELYRYNIRSCTRLQKLLSQDPNLPTYSRHLRHLHRSSQTLLVVIILFSLLVVVLVYRLFISRQMKAGNDIAQQIQRTREEMTAAKQKRLSMLQDQLAQSRYEENRLHVQNQILDNCLSTIKHESMYYPARIRQLCETMQDSDIEQLGELVSYYHHIYTLLSRQADAEVEKPALRLTSIPFGDSTLLADADLFGTLMKQMQRFAQSRGSELDQEIRQDGNRAEVRLTLHDERLTDEDLHELFYPSSGHIPLLVARQIIREHDAAYGNPGLRLTAERTDAAHVTIRFQLLTPKT